MLKLAPKTGEQKFQDVWAWVTQSCFRVEGDDPFKCLCPCHTPEGQESGMLHFVACCDSCRFCDEMIEYSNMSSHELICKKHGFTQFTAMLC